MRAVVQRVSSASVTVADRTVGAIDHGLLVLVGVETEDGPADVEYIAGKIGDLRVFEDGDGWELLDRRQVVRPRESIEWTRRLTEVGVFAGISAGAVMCGAARCAETIDEGVIAIILADGGWKYLSTGAWTDDLDEVEARAKGTIYF